MDERHRGSDLPPVIQRCGNTASLLTAGWNSDVMSLKFMLDRADALGFLIPRLGSWNGSAALSEQTEDAGSERVITRVRLYMWVRQSDEETWTNGERAAHVLLHPTTTAGWASRVTCLRCFGFIWAKSVLCHWQHDSYSSREKPTVGLLSSSPSDWTTRTAIIQIIKHFWQFCINERLSLGPCLCTEHKPNLTRLMRLPRRDRPWSSDQQESAHRRWPRDDSAVHLVTWMVTKGNTQVSRISSLGLACIMKPKHRKNQKQMTNPKNN